MSGERKSAPVKVQREVTAGEIAAMSPGQTSVYGLPGWEACQRARARARELERDTSARYRVTVNVKTNCVTITRES